ncbi:SRPBCC family protein [Nocardia brasiliensis]
MRVTGVEVRRVIAGDPRQVYELIADVTRMSEWSPESAGAEWISGEPGAVGSTFRGHNRRAWARWSTLCTVIAADPGRRFAFAVEDGGINGEPGATWAFEIFARPGGCEVVERTVDSRNRFYRSLTWVTTGFQRRSARNRQTMQQTLSALAYFVENDHGH